MKRKGWDGFLTKIPKAKGGTNGPAQCPGLQKNKEEVGRQKGLRGWPKKICQKGGAVGRETPIQETDLEVWERGNRNKLHNGGKYGRDVVRYTGPEKKMKVVRKKPRLSGGEFCGFRCRQKKKKET